MNKFFEDIIPISEKQWKNKVQVELEGLDYNKTLVWGTNDHINVKPLYLSNDVDYYNLKPISNATKIISTNIKLENKYCNAYFITENNSDQLESIPSESDLYFQYHETLNFNVLKKLPHKKFLDFDVYGYYAQNGVRLKETRKADRDLIKKIVRESYCDKCIAIQADVYQNAGANHIQEIAISLSHAVQYIEDFGAEIADKIYFKFAIGSNFFFEIAKLRAFRFLWRMVMEQYDLKNEAHIVTSVSKRNKSSLDKDNNIVRASLEISASFLGKSDAIIVENEINPCDYNDDYISGSYYIENLTDQMGEKALELFKTIQNSGGFLKSIENETIQDFIYSTAKKEQKDFDENILQLIGVNKNKISFDKNERTKKEKVIKQVRFLPIVPTRLAEKEEKK